MTQFSKHEVINNLRRKVQKLEDTIKDVRAACLQINSIDVAYKAEELAKLPQRILQITGG